MATFPYGCRLSMGATSHRGGLSTVADMEFTSPPTPVIAVPSDGWRTVSTLTWAGVFGALLAVAISSRTIGRPIWWLGPSSAPASALLITIPLGIVLIPLVTTLRAPRHMATASSVCSFALIASGLIEIESNPAISLAVVVIGFAALTESIAVVVVMRHYR